MTARLVAVLLLVAPSARAYCPCYQLSSKYNDHMCGVAAAAGTNPTIAQWQPIFDLVSQGPSVWGSKGPSVGDIGQGCGKPEPTHSVPARFPCELLKAIAMTETGWRQFCRPDTPADQAKDPERTIISFDCGYGIGQVTSGMHVGESPAFDRGKVASDPTYNMATGTQILASKWKATKCVGDNQPRIVEHWYSATWAYNGLAIKNSPNNAVYDAHRPVYSGSGSYPYQEKVFGYIEHPPTAAHWPSVALAYPNRADVGTGSSPLTLPEPNCAGPTDCGNKRSTHATACGAQPPPDMAVLPDLVVPTPPDLVVPADLVVPPFDMMVLVVDQSGAGEMAAGGADLLASDGPPTADRRAGDRASPDEDGALPVDAGGQTIDGGCSCRAAHRSPAASLPLLLGLGLLALALRRARR